ncbi:MAG: hypothetical protein IPO63_03110 [Bacteroidetes bacterium]|nr:hypothetical protein [Bacteroidota bacterium]
MKRNILKSIFLLGTTLTLLSFNLQVPAGWVKGGSQAKSYEMITEKGVGPDGSNAATIKSIDKKIKGFGTLMQSSAPTKYLGKRVRMTGQMKSKDVANWAGFWFRVDQANARQSASFDNMHDGKTDRSIKGTTEWKSYEIVLDIPEHATNMAYGALLTGTGQIWFTKIDFEIVDSSVPTTGKEKNTEPSNLDFKN